MMGILYGIGVGPGEAELMTIKAVRTIEKCHTIILPTEPKEECYAYQIIKQVLPNVDEKKIVCLHFPMIHDSKALEQAHDEIYHKIREFLFNGQTVAFLTIGDPSLYATYGYVHSRAKKDSIEAVIVPGVPSICAVAGALGIPLGESQEEIHIIPGWGDIMSSLNYPGTKVFMKSGKRLAELKNILKNYTEQKDVWAVSNCGLSNQKCMYGIDQLDSECGYLTIVIVKEKEKR